MYEGEGRMKNAKELNKMTENAIAEKHAFYQQMATSKELFEKLEKCMEESAKSGGHSIVLEYFFQDSINFKWPPDKTDYRLTYYRFRNEVKQQLEPLGYKINESQDSPLKQSEDYYFDSITYISWD